MGLFKEKKPTKILRGMRTLFFLVSMMVSLLVFSPPVLLALTDALLPSAILSVFLYPLSMETLSSHVKGYDFCYSTIDVPLISIARSILIICVYCLCDGPGISHGPYLGVTTICSVLSLGFVSMKVCVFWSIAKGGEGSRTSFQQLNHLEIEPGSRQYWALAIMFISSLVCAVGHVVVAYRTSCRERRKLLVYRIDLEAVSACNNKFPAYQKVLQ